MSLQKKYQLLLQDTIQHLKETTDQFIFSDSETFSLFKDHITLKPHLSLPKLQAPKPNPFFKPIPKPKEEPPKITPPLEPKEIKPLEKAVTKEPEQKINIAEDSFEDLKKIVGKIAPNLAIQNPLDDKKAKQLSQKWKVNNEVFPISVLAYKEDERTYKFLIELSKALDVCFYPSKVVFAYQLEKENQWDIFLSSKELKMIIAQTYMIAELNNLRGFYKEFPQERTSFLKEVPLFLMADAHLYLKEPLLKPSLFKTLKQKISTING
ncbi:MAG: hypothetical protein HZB76_06305 [Chlamydiae bacterium]|nr:hypothetical protein [Chlamydiota bacterium]